MRYIISYDITATGDDYNTTHRRMVSAIRALGGHQVLLSQWVVRRPGESAQLLLDGILRHVGRDDVRMLVVGLDDTDRAVWETMHDLGDV